MAGFLNGRTMTVAAGLLLLGPPLTVGAIGLGIPATLAWGVPVAIAAIAASSGRVPPLPLDQARAHPVAAIVWALALVVAVSLSIRTSLFAHDANAPQYSVSPGDRFRKEHLCMTAYYEAARLLPIAGTRIYDPELYRPGGVPRRLGPFTVDYYHYPPPFLLLPTAVRAAAPDFFDFRRVWFALQATTMVGLWLVIAWWVGGAIGRRFALAGVLLTALPVSWAALQVGNIQTTVVALALFGAMAAASGRIVPAAALLTGAALAKIFPGLLLAHVLTWRRPGFATWAAVWAVGITAGTAAAFGVDVFREFLFVELPRMLSGESFPQTEAPWAAPVNQSLYGFTVKVRHLGLTVLDPAAGKAVTRVLVAILGLAALVVGWRIVGKARLDGSAERFGVLAIAFGFVNLASFFSPFVGGAYGAVYTIWLGALVAVGMAQGNSQRAMLATVVVLVVSNALTSSPRQGVAPTTATMAIAMMSALASFAINIAAICVGARNLRRAAGDCADERLPGPLASATQRAQGT